MFQRLKDLLVFMGLILQAEEFSFKETQRKFIVIKSLNSPFRSVLNAVLVLCENEKQAENIKKNKIIDKNLPFWTLRIEKNQIKSYKLNRFESDGYLIFCFLNKNPIFVTLPINTKVDMFEILHTPRYACSINTTPSISTPVNKHTAPTGLKIVPYGTIILK